MKKIILFALTMLIPATAFALMPPMTEAELKNESNMIVKGSVVKVECTGKFGETGCAKLTGYKATLKINETVKGENLDQVSLLFDKYDFKKGCVGSPDMVHYEGEEGLYYLQCKKDQCHLTHWNGVDYFKKGGNSLPKCKK